MSMPYRYSIDSVVPLVNPRVSSAERPRLTRGRSPSVPDGRRVQPPVRHQAGTLRRIPRSFAMRSAKKTFSND
jgi:hypothetical protein